MPETSWRPSRRNVLIGGAMIVAGGASAVAQPRQLERSQMKRPLARLVPETFGGWTIGADEGVILPEADERDPLYQAVLARHYVGDGLAEVMLAVAYGAAQSLSMRVHRPETCYSSAGFTVSALRKTDFRVGDAGRVPGMIMTAQRDERCEQIGYWRRISNTFPTTTWAERLIVAQRNLAGVIPDGILVRFSTVDDDLLRSRQTLDRFAAALVGSLDMEGRLLLLGAQFEGGSPSGRSTTTT